MKGFQGAPDHLFDHFPNQYLIDGPRLLLQRCRPCTPVLLFDHAATWLGEEHAERMENFPTSRSSASPRCGDGFHPDSPGGQVTLRNDGSRASANPSQRHLLGRPPARAPFGHGRDPEFPPPAPRWVRPEVANRPGLLFALWPEARRAVARTSLWRPSPAPGRQRLSHMGGWQPWPRAGVASPGPPGALYFQIDNLSVHCPLFPHRASALTLSSRSHALVALPPWL